MEQFGKRHSLVITRVTEEYFGNFSCFAKNELEKVGGLLNFQVHYSNNRTQD